MIRSNTGQPHSPRAQPHADKTPTTYSDVPDDKS